MNGRPWTEADRAELVALYPHHRTADVARRLGRSVSAVYGMAEKLGLSKTPEYLASPEACRLRRGKNVGAATQFRPGMTPWNKGTHFTAGGRSAETRFQPGSQPHNTKPIGAERLMQGYRQRKVTDSGYPPGDWMGLHLIVWMEHVHGPLPHNHVIAFRDGNKLNCDFANLEVVSRTEMMRRNTRHNLPKPLSDVIALRGALNRKLNKLRREAREHPDQHD